MNHQPEYIEYLKEFAEKNKCHIWLGGSFLRGNATAFSDVDVSIYCDTAYLSEFIYGYSKPAFISHTSNPAGILIIIYEDGVAVDLDIIDKIEVPDGRFFHFENIKERKFTKNETICNEFALRNDEPYQMSRLFHRSLIKYLAGKKELGISVANEIAAYLNFDGLIDEENYNDRLTCILNDFKGKYQMDERYYTILLRLLDF
ncbi:MAG: nucleotidyltransferase domain-containing protein [Lachnospiraceae bacterium]|nr:nucleotidyltransferase domain-containing protein [Lachnospiraceae bacterium]